MEWQIMHRLLNCIGAPDDESHALQVQNRIDYTVETLVRFIQKHKKKDDLLFEHVYWTDDSKQFGFDMTFFPEANNEAEILKYKDSILKASQEISKREIIEIERKEFKAWFIFNNGAFHEARVYREYKWKTTKPTTDIEIEQIITSFHVTSNKTSDDMVQPELVIDRIHEKIEIMKYVKYDENRYEFEYRNYTCLLQKKEKDWIVATFQDGVRHIKTTEVTNTDEAVKAILTGLEPKPEQGQVVHVTKWTHDTSQPHSHTPNPPPGPVPAGRRRPHQQAHGSPPFQQPRTQGSRPAPPTGP